ncbi:MAG: mechanosensitive ion channel [Gammaproteobacteria bacterium]|nr:MAG: mechanosensitive ion channel [Gammaproteobacteria bacterium]
MNQEQIGQLLDPELINTYLIPWGIRIALALAIFVIGRWIAKVVVRFAERMMGKARLDDMLIAFLGNILYTVLLLVVVIAALDQLGVQTTSLLAVFGAAGLAIGLALKDSLANFSSGVMLIIFRPFKAGDLIEAAGITGIVEEVRIFNTLFRTADNREIIVPNSHIYAGPIVNVSARPTRRIDMVFGIGYEDDIKKARQLIEAAFAADERILKDPAPAVAMAELADSSVNFNVRPWVKSEDYWAVRSDLMERIKLSFDENGISIPYPQQDVYMHNVA